MNSMQHHIMVTASSQLGHGVSISSISSSTTTAAPLVVLWCVLGFLGQFLVKAVVALLVVPKSKNY